MVRLDGWSEHLVVSLYLRDLVGLGVGQDVSNWKILDVCVTCPDVVMFITWDGSDLTTTPICT